jgi:hypothetical protein
MAQMAKPDDVSFTSDDPLMLGLSLGEYSSPADGLTSVSGETVRLINDTHYAPVREKYGVPLRLFANREYWDFDKLKPSGGKGGDMMGRTSDGAFFIKEVSGGDQKTLLKYSKGYTEHICKTESFISRFYMHFERVESKKFYVVMNNWHLDARRKNAAVVEDSVETPAAASIANEPKGPYKVKGDFVGLNQFINCYDLKGSADDKTQRFDGAVLVEVHKRCWSPMMCGCGITEERKSYYEGKQHAKDVKFEVTQQDYNVITERIRADVDLLTDLGLMDYSLLVGIKRCPVSSAGEFKLSGGFTAGDATDQPYLVTHDGVESAYYIGIIDFLQEWVCGKKCAQCIKTCAGAPKPLATAPPSVYGPRFLECFQSKFVVVQSSMPGFGDDTTPRSSQGDGSVMI